MKQSAGGHCRRRDARKCQRVMIAWTVPREEVIIVARIARVVRAERVLERLAEQLERRRVGSKVGWGMVIATIKGSLRVLRERIGAKIGLYRIEIGRIEARGESARSLRVRQRPRSILFGDGGGKASGGIGYIDALDSGRDCVLRRGVVRFAARLLLVERGRESAGNKVVGRCRSPTLIDRREATFVASVRSRCAARRVCSSRGRSA